jgi:hypothetical protein
MANGSPQQAPAQIISWLERYNRNDSAMWELLRDAELLQALAAHYRIEVPQQLLDALRCNRLDIIISKMVDQADRTIQNRDMVFSTPQHAADAARLDPLVQEAGEFIVVVETTPEMVGDSDRPWWNWDLPPHDEDPEEEQEHRPIVAIWVLNRETCVWEQVERLNERVCVTSDMVQAPPQAAGGTLQAGGSHAGLLNGN